jgi:hypothetical protein
LVCEREEEEGVGGREKKKKKRRRSKKKGVEGEGVARSLASIPFSRARFQPLAPLFSLFPLHRELERAAALPPARRERENTQQKGRENGSARKRSKVVRRRRTLAAAALLPFLRFAAPLCGMFFSFVHPPRRKSDALIRLNEREHEVTCSRARRRGRAKTESAIERGDGASLFLLSSSSLLFALTWTALSGSIEILGSEKEAPESMTSGVMVVLLLEKNEKERREKKEKGSRF